MLEALHICRAYGQPPAWWQGLDRSDQALLLGEARFRAEREALYR